jgi:hypothetical protein
MSKSFMGKEFTNSDVNYPLAFTSIPQFMALTPIPPHYIRIEQAVYYSFSPLMFS